MDWSAGLKEGSGATDQSPKRKETKQIPAKPVDKNIKMKAKRKFIVINRRNELLRVPALEAVFYEAYGNYCYGVFPNKQKVVLPFSLTKLIETISHLSSEDDPKFVRIGKRFVINMDMIVQVNMTTQKLILSDFNHPGNFALPMSKEALKELKALFNQ